MSRYWMLESCAFMDNGEALYYRTIPKEPVEISDEAAEFLGDKVRLFEPDEPAEESTDRPEGIEGKTGTLLDGVLTGNEIRELEGLPPKPKRKHKVEEPTDDDTPEGQPPIEEEENPDGDPTV